MGGKGRGGSCRAAQCATRGRVALLLSLSLWMAVLVVFAFQMKRVLEERREGGGRGGVAETLRWAEWPSSSSLPSLPQLWRLSSSSLPRPWSWSSSSSPPQQWPSSSSSSLPWPFPSIRGVSCGGSTRGKRKVKETIRLGNQFSNKLVGGKWSSKSFFVAKRTTKTLFNTVKEAGESWESTQSKRLGPTAAAATAAAAVATAAAAPTAAEAPTAAGRKTASKDRIVPTVTQFTGFPFIWKLTSTLTFRTLQMEYGGEGMLGQSLYPGFGLNLRGLLRLLVAVSAGVATPAFEAKIQKGSSTSPLAGQPFHTFSPATLSLHSDVSSSNKTNEKGKKKSKHMGGDGRNGDGESQQAALVAADSETIWGTLFFVSSDTVDMANDLEERILSMKTEEQKHNKQRSQHKSQLDQDDQIGLEPPLGNRQQLLKYYGATEKPLLVDITTYDELLKFLDIVALSSAGWKGKGDAAIWRNEDAASWRKDDASSWRKGVSFQHLKEEFGKKKASVKMTFIIYGDGRMGLSVGGVLGKNKTTNAAELADRSRAENNILKSLYGINNNNNKNSSEKKDLGRLVFFPLLSGWRAHGQQKKVEDLIPRQTK